MKLRHAAALALVGWYLMMPPPTKAPKYGWSVSLSEPLIRWHHVGSYDTAAECENARDSLHTQGLDRIRRYAKNPFADEAAIGQEDASAECIATDDPRLKEK